MILTTERKAELFDYIASHLSEGKFNLAFGSSEWVYADGRRTPEWLAAAMENLQGYEAGDCPE